jgi:hypothetical protein
VGIVLNIYIYGGSNFKKEIHKTLIDSSIKHELDENSKILELNSLEELKNAIFKNPKDIYLIDDSKIIKKNSINRKIKFLAPKDGIEEEFLLDSGIADLSVDSLAEIPKYIIRKVEQEKEFLEENSDLSIKTEDNKIEDSKDEISVEQDIVLDDELSSLLEKNDSFEATTKEIENSIEELENLFVDEAQQESVYKEDSVDFENNFGLNNISFDYDDNSIVNSKEFSDAQLLDSLMSKDAEEPTNIEETFDEINFLDEVLNSTRTFEDSFTSNDNIDEEENDDNNDEIESLSIEDTLLNLISNDEIDENSEEDKDSLHLDELLSKIEESKEEDLVLDEILTKEIEIKEELPFKGDEMLDEEFKDLEFIDEKDMLDALNLDSSQINSSHSSKVELVENSSEVLNISSANMDDLAKLFTKVLTNKTLEIIIKIKD